MKLPFGSDPSSTPADPVTSVKVEDSVPIQVEAQTPIAVTVDRAGIEGLTGRAVSTTSDTPQADARLLAAQRMNWINRLWEYTQATLAISLTLATIYVAVIGTREESETLKNALFVVLGFYFGRTNHSRPTPTDPTGAGRPPPFRADEGE